MDDDWYVLVPDYDDDGVIVYRPYVIFDEKAAHFNDNGLTFLSEGQRYFFPYAAMLSHIVITQGDPTLDDQDPVSTH